MRIGVDIRELRQGVRTGIGRVVEAFIEEAPRLRPGWQLLLYGDPTTRSDVGGTARQLRILPHRSRLWFDQVNLPQALAKDRVQVFYSPYYKAPVFSPCPAVVTIHDALFLRFGGWRLKNSLFKPWARIIASRVFAVLTDSEHSRHDLENLLRIPSPRIEVIPLGVSHRFSPAAGDRSSEVARRLEIPGRYILTVTNFRPHKNDVTLIRAFARVASDLPEIALVLAGRPFTFRHELRDTIQGLGLGERVIFPGYISDSDLPSLYAGATAFAFPSLCEGFGLPVLEAMASGVPVACSSGSSLTEVAGGAALLVNPEDVPAWANSLKRIATDDLLRKQLVLAGRERAMQFTWQKSVTRILSVLERATQS